MKKNTSGTSGEGGQNPVVTPTKPPDREHELSRDCWCQPIVDGAAPDGIDLDRQIVRMRGEVEHCKELHGDGSEWAVESGSILASLIELRDLRQQLAAERGRVVEARDVLVALGYDGDEAGLYESEYDGRTYTMCRHCDYQDDVRPVHREDCPTIAASAFIRERYDHDYGGWMIDESENVCIQIVSDQAYVFDDDEQARAESAEAKLARVEKLLREPSEEVITAMALAHEHSPCHDLIGPMEDAFCAMSAELLREIEEGK